MGGDGAGATSPSILRRSRRNGGRGEPAMRLKAKPSTLVAALLVAVATIFIINSNRGVTPYSWQSFGTFIVVGLSLGGIYAITAGGLVVTYATTGIFNFAHGA